LLTDSGQSSDVVRVSTTETEYSIIGTGRIVAHILNQLEQLVPSVNRMDHIQPEDAETEGNLAVSKMNRVHRNGIRQG